MQTEDPLRPPRERGMPRALLLALLMHGLLIALLAIGVHWHSHQPDAVEAELWAPTAHLAAPPAPKPTPQPTPTPPPQPAPPPPPPPRVQPQPAPDEAQIALQRKKALQAERKAQRELEAQKLAEQQKLAQQKLEQKALEKRKLAEQKKLEHQQKLAEQKKLEQQELAEQKKLEQQKLAEQKKQAQQLAREQKAERAAYLKSMMAQAGDGAADSTGTAARTSGPSGGYGARLATLVKQNVVYPQLAQIQGNPQVLLSVTLDPNTGEVVGVHVKRSSGVPSWDAAVVRAVQRLGRFPSDHGRWYTPMDVQAGPRDTH